MGQEARCRATFGGKTSLGKALLETEELIFRGDFRLKIPFRSITSLAATKGRLRVESPAGVATFELGVAAEVWAGKIRSPKGRIDKLGVKPEAKVSVLGVDDAAFREELEARVGGFSSGRAAKGSDIIVVGMKAAADLPRLEALRGSIKPNGAIWVVWPKGRKEFREDDVRAYALEIGLVDVKVMKFSETHSALKLVIPVAQR
jgi:hypothetical protein